MERAVGWREPLDGESRWVERAVGWREPLGVKAAGGGGDRVRRIRRAHVGCV
jgi:hypothetical protein